MTTVLPVNTLTARGERWIRSSSVLLIIMVATAAGLLSWNGLTFLAVGSGIPVGFSWLLALAVDGMILLATAQILHASLTGQPVLFGWILTAFGVSISIWGNIAAVGDHSLQSQVVHGIAPVSLFLSVEAFSRIVKHRITVTQQLQAEQQKIAEKEAKAKARAEQVSTTVHPSKSGAGKGHGGKRGGQRLLETDPEVADYRAVLENLPADATKASRVDAILRRYPHARNGHIAFAMGIENQKSIATTIVRIRERILNEQSDDGDRFQQIVKDFQPAGVSGVANSESK